LNMRVWMFDFSPLVLLLFIALWAWVIVKYFPEVSQYVSL
jgi:hypothetical protein